MQRKWLLGYVVLASLVLMALLVWGAPGPKGLGRLSETLPTPLPRPPLNVGETYWIGTLTPMTNVRGTSIPTVAIYNKPGRITDPGITIVGVFVDARPVTLAEVRDKWCYIQANNIHGQPVMGWTLCRQLQEVMPGK